MNREYREEHEMTDHEFDTLLKAIRIIAEHSETKEEFLKELDRLLKEKKKPQ